MKIEKVYLWSDLPWDIAIAQGMKPDSVLNELDAIKDKDSDEWWLESQKLESIANTKLAEKLWLDIYNGKLHGLKLTVISRYGGPQRSIHLMGMQNRGLWQTRKTLPRRFLGIHLPVTLHVN